MTAEEVVYAVIDALDGLGIPYMLVGSFSSNLYGVPRSTKDADVVVELGNASPSQVRAKLGPEFRLDPQMSFETVTSTYRFIVTHDATAFKVEFFLLSDDPHDRERFARRRRAPMPAREAYVASPEDVVITKLRWSKGGKRAKDLDDVRSVILVQRDRLDWDYVRRWCHIHGTQDLLDRVRAEAEAG
jgi:hypothetical protein